MKTGSVWISISSWWTIQGKKSGSSVILVKSKRPGTLHYKTSNIFKTFLQQTSFKHLFGKVILRLKTSYILNCKAFKRRRGLNWENTKLKKARKEYENLEEYQLQITIIAKSEHKKTDFKVMQFRTKWR